MWSGVGITLGGGKPKKPKGYCTPVRANCILVEVGGDLEFFEIEPWLTKLADKMPFAARAVSQEMLEAEEEQQVRDEQRNLNMFTFKHCLDNNLGGCNWWASPYDYKWYGKYD